MSRIHSVSVARDFPGILVGMWQAKQTRRTSPPRWVPPRPRCSLWVDGKVGGELLPPLSEVTLTPSDC